MRRLSAQGLTPLLTQLGGLERRIAEHARDLSPQERLALATLRAALSPVGLLIVSRQAAEAEGLAGDWLRAHPATLLTGE